MPPISQEIPAAVPRGTPPARDLSAELTPKQRLRVAMGNLKKLNERYMIAGGLVIVRDKNKNTP